MWNKKGGEGLQGFGFTVSMLLNHESTARWLVTYGVEPGPTLMTQEQHRHGDIRLCQDKLFNLGRWQKSSISIIRKKEKVGLVTLIFHSVLTTCTKWNMQRKRTHAAFSKQRSHFLTLQLFSSSAFTIMVPHFFPGMPLFMIQYSKTWDYYHQQRIWHHHNILSTCILPPTLQGQMTSWKIQEDGSRFLTGAAIRAVYTVEGQSVKTFSLFDNSCTGF